MKTILRIFLIVTAVSLSASSLMAQWIDTHIPTKARISCFAFYRAGLFAGTLDGEVFRSTDYGTNWMLVDSELTRLPVITLTVYPNWAGGTYLLAGTLSGVFLSTNDGINWTDVSTGLTKPWVKVLTVAPDGSGGTNLFTVIDGGSGLFRSVNNGTSWTAVNADWPASSITTLTYTDKTLIAGTDGFGVFLSTDLGTSWKDASSGLKDTYVNTLALDLSTTLVAGTEGGVFLSSNMGTSWAVANVGLTSQSVLALEVLPSGSGRPNLFAGTKDGGVFLANDNRTSWTAVNDGLSNLRIHSLAGNDMYLFAGTDGSGVWRRSLSEMTTSAESSSGSIPHSLSLGQNHPNPVSSITTIPYSLNRTSFITLKIYNPLGKEIETLVVKELPAGEHQISWNRKDLPSGAYTYRLTTGTHSVTRKLLVLR